MVVRSGGVGVTHQIGTQPSHVDGPAFQWPSGVQAGQQQQILDQSGHSQ